MKPFIPGSCVTEQPAWGKKQISLREISSQESNFYFFLMINLMYLLGQVSGVLIIFKKITMKGRNFIKVEQAVVEIGGWQKEPDTRVLSE